MAKKWLDSIEKRKRRSNVCDRQTDGWTDRQSQWQKKIDSQARRVDQHILPTLIHICLLHFHSTNTNVITASVQVYAT